MNIEQFIQDEQLKFAVIAKASWEADEVAQSISPSPRAFTHQGVDMVLLSICVTQVQALHDYVRGAVEYNLTVGTGLVTLLLHSQVQELLAEE